MVIATMIAVLLYFSVLFGFALLTFAFFWYETANSRHRDHLERLSKGRLGRWLARGVVSSFISQNLMILCYPLRFWRKLWRPIPDPVCPRPPVILIHGLYHNASGWFLYQWLLKRKGFRNTCAFEYSSACRSVDELVENLAQEINELSRLLPNQRVILIGHSLGGLVARIYVQDPKNAKKVAAVVTLGSPHRGTKLAVFGIGKLAKSLTYEGQLFRELEQNTESSEVPRLAIYSPIDNMVLPNESLRLMQAGWSHLESFPVSHVAMLYHRPLAKLVIEYLQIRALSPVVDNSCEDAEKCVMESQDQR